MPPQRRMGAKDSEVRSRLVEAAIRIVQKEGCNALTAGRLAEAEGLSRQSVHYYFGTIEDIFIEILRVQAEEVRRRAETAFASGNPLRVIWQFRRATSALTLELMAMATRSGKLRKELATFTGDLARIAIEAVESYAERNAVELPAPAEVIATVLTSLSYTLAMGNELGMRTGHPATAKAVEAWLDDLEAGKA